MKKTIISIIIIVFASWVGLFVGSAINGPEATESLFAMIAGFACTIYAIETQKKDK